MMLMQNAGTPLLLVILFGAGCRDVPVQHSAGPLDGGMAAPMEDASEDTLEDANPSSLPEDAGGGVADDVTVFDAGPFHRICDGTLDLKFGARVVGSLSPSPDMMGQIGISYIYVRGDCAYWSNRSVGSFAATHSGVLAADEEHQLSLDFGYGNWDALRDSYGGSGGTSHTAFELYDSKRRILCAEMACDPYGPDMNRTLVSRLYPRYDSWVKRMEGMGGEAKGGQVRVLAFRLDAQTIAFAKMNKFLLPWASEWSLSVAAGALDGIGTLIDGMRADDLRGLRAKYVVAGAFVVPGAVSPTAQFTFQEDGAMGAGYFMWFRDALPLESADGVIPFETKP